MEVDAVGGADVLMTEPEGYGGRVNAVAQQVHGTAVTQHVGRDVLGRERRARGGCRSDVALDQAPDGVAAPAAFWAWEQRITGSAISFVEPNASRSRVSRRSGVIRSLRPLPWQRTWAPVPSSAESAEYNRLILVDS